MSDPTIITVCSSLVTLLGVVVTSYASIRKTEHAINISQAVTDTKLDALTEKVDSQNAAIASFTVEIPAIKEHLKHHDSEIKDLKQAVSHGGK